MYIYTYMYIYIYIYIYIYVYINKNQLPLFSVRWVEPNPGGSTIQYLSVLKSVAVYWFDLFNLSKAKS